MTFDFNVSIVFDGPVSTPNRLFSGRPAIFTVVRANTEHTREYGGPGKSRLKVEAAKVDVG